MHYGLLFFPTTYAMHPAEVAKAAEDRGFESLWVAEHTHIPACRTSPYPGGGDLPQMYYDVYDPFVALTAAATATTTLKIGTGVCLVIEHDPIVLAKQVATLDQVSGGRFLFGVGGGWNAEEMSNHGTPFDRRWKLLRERVEAMKLMWTEEQAEYHGEFVNFDPIVSSPKPVQQPHPPIHVGGVAPWGIRRTVRYGNGWIPIWGRGDEDPAAKFPELRQTAEDAGRDPDSIELSLYGCPAKAEIASHYREAGAHRVVFALPSRDKDDLLPRLDRYAEVVAAVG